MYLYGHTFKIIAIKRNLVDQSSCKSFSELIDGYQVYKNSSVSGWKREKINRQRKKRGVTTSLIVT